MGLGQPLELKPPDFQRLARDGVVLQLPESQAFALMWHQVQKGHRAETAWRAGYITFPRLCATLGRSPAYLFQCLRPGGLVDRPILPAPLPRALPIPRLAPGAVLLTGDPEILVRRDLGLLGALPGLAGDDVVMGLQRETFDRVMQFLDVAPVEEREHLAHLRDLRASHPGVVWPSREAKETSDAAHAFEVASEGILAALRSLASRELTKDERWLRQLREPCSMLGWVGAATVPDLALLLLLRMDAGELMNLAPDVRQRWVNDLPLVAEDREAVPAHLATLVQLAAVNHAGSLSDV